MLFTKIICTFLSKKGRSGTFQTKIFPSKAITPNKSIKARINCPLNGDQKSLEEAVSKYLASNMEPPIVHVSTVHLVAFYFISICQLLKTQGFIVTFLHMHVTYFGHVHTTLTLQPLSFTDSIPDLIIISNIEYVHVCTSMYMWRSEVNIETVHQPLHLIFLRLGFPLNLELTNSARLRSSFLCFPLAEVYTSIIGFILVQFGWLFV